MGSDLRTCPGSKGAAFPHFRARQRTCPTDVAGSGGQGRRQNRRMTVAAAVIDVGWVNGLAAIPSLGRAGLRVLALDLRTSALGFSSKSAERSLCPDPRLDATR